MPESQGDIDARKVQEIFRHICALMTHQGPDLQGAVIADLLALWLAGHPRDARERVLADLVNFTRELVPLNEQMLANWIGGGGGEPQAHAALALVRKRGHSKSAPRATREPRRTH